MVVLAGVITLVSLTIHDYVGEKVLSAFHPPTHIFLPKL